MPNASHDNFSHFKPSHYRNIRNIGTRIANASAATLKGNLFSAGRELITGYEIKISKSSSDFLELLSPYQRIEITRIISNLSADPRPSNASPQKGATDVMVIVEANTGFVISYKVKTGKVFVLEVVPNASLKGEKKELPALYLVKKTADGWIEKRTDKVTTQHAAVNGQSNAKDRAVGLMGEHISFSYKSDAPREYTLFHNPSDGGFWDTYESSRDQKQATTAVTKKFSQTLASVQKQGEPVKWIAHSQGGLIFSEGVRYHMANVGTDLSMNSVQFNAGANNIKKTNPIMMSAGITVHGYNNHPFDPVPNIIGNNAQDWVSLAGSVVGFAFVFQDNARKSPHTLPYDNNSNVVQKAYNIKDKTAQTVQGIINSLPF